ncbi:MAG TPA: hypothetical protein VIF02_07745 [Methylocella sp.]|jgi:hypothetical protein
MKLPLNDQLQSSRTKRCSRAHHGYQQDAIKRAARARPNFCQLRSLIQKPMIFKGSILSLDASKHAGIEASHQLLPQLFAMLSQRTIVTGRSGLAGSVQAAASSLRTNRTALFERVDQTKKIFVG